MAVTVKKENQKLKTYKITGATLDDVWKQIQKKGPKDPNDGKKVAALTTTQLKIDAGSAGFAPDGEITENPDGTFTAKAKFDRFELVHSADTLYPNHDGKLSVKPLLEWGKYVALVLGHEKMHVNKSEAEAEKIAREIEALRGEASGADRKEAAKNAAGDLLKTFKKSFDQKKLDARITAVHKAFDKSSGHGPKLNTKVK